MQYLQSCFISTKPIRVFLYAATGLIIFLAMSCRTQKPVQYLQGPFDTTMLNKINIPQPIIQTGDVIGITVYSDNPELTGIYNQQTTTSASASAGISSGMAGGGSGPTAQGYLVDANGNIRFQTLGELHIAGMTKPQLELLLKEKLTPYLKNPYCNIRLLNHKFTILGEVSRQGVYPIANEKLSILEALGLAGDLTMYGEKDSIMVIRELNGRRSFGYLNVSKSDVMISPYYYLQQNDVIIVKSNPKKPTVSDQSTTRNLTIVATIATILTSIAVVFNILR